MAGKKEMGNMGRGNDDYELDMALVNSISKNKQSNRSTYRATDSRREERYDRPNTRNSNKKTLKKKAYKKKKRKVFRTLLIFIIVMVGLTFLAVKYVPGAKQFLISNCGGTLVKCFVSEDTYNSIFDNEFEKDDIVVNEGIDMEKFKGYYTIALFGIDSRDEQLDAGVNSDSIILVSINQDTGHVVMSSIYRDTWLKIASTDDMRHYRKINSAYCTGGPKAVINTINANFDLNISDYITINFQGLATIIDMLDGLDVTITEDERGYINSYLKENRKVTGMDSPDVTQSGKVHLNGLQAVAYCRIRYCAYYYPDGSKAVDDMGRTARQRHIMSLMIDKAKKVGVSNVLDIAEAVFSSEENIIKTSIPYDDMLDMISVFIDFELGETKGFPFTYDFPESYLTNYESALVPGGLVYNVGRLHEFLYGDKEYKPSKSVMEIDAELKLNTGIQNIEK